MTGIFISDGTLLASKGNCTTLALSLFDVLNSGITDLMFLER
jgi:hypothetical protein